jgi:glutaredoxin
VNGRRALAGAQLATWLRGGAGSRVVAPGARPKEPLVLYEFEACPFCRRVREALTRLDLEALVRPCPKGGQRYRAEVEALGGREQFPFLIDPNTGARMYESAEIVAYLQREYGTTAAPASGRPGAIRTALLVASGLGRGAAGSRARASRSPAIPLVLYGFEAQPASRLVREVLCELELAHSLRPAAPGSVRRNDPAFDPCTRELPHLFDPNTRSDHRGALAIVRHLEETYALAPKPH